MTSPADELRTAAEKLGLPGPKGAFTATSSAAAIIRARHFVATLLKSLAGNPDDTGIREGNARHVGCDPATCPAAAALAVARAINGTTT